MRLCLGSDVVIDVPWLSVMYLCEPVSTSLNKFSWMCVGWTSQWRKSYPLRHTRDEQVHNKISGRWTPVRGLAFKAKEWHQVMDFPFNSLCLYINLWRNSVSILYICKFCIEWTFDMVFFLGVLWWGFQKMLCTCSFCFCQVGPLALGIFDIQTICSIPNSTARCLEMKQINKLLSLLSVVDGVLPEY